MEPIKDKKPKPVVDKTKLEASKAEKAVLTTNSIIVTKDGDCKDS